LTDIALIVVTLIVVEVILRLNPLFYATKILLISQRSLHVISSNSISDHWKEKALLQYALKMLVCTLQILFRLGAALIVGAGLVWLVEYLSADKLQLMQRLGNATGLIISSLAAIFYWYFRERLVSN
jgi:hypothetical protein